jgi:hypothetical protein
MKWILLTALLLWSAVAEATVITYADASLFQAGATAPLTQTSLVSDTFAFFATNTIAVDGLTFSVDACSIKGIASCWTQDSGGYMANRITPETYTWGTGMSLTDFGFAMGTYGTIASHLVTVTEIDNTVTQFIYAINNATSPFIGVHSDLGLRSVVVADDPADTFTSNFSLATLWHSEIVPEGTPEPASLALLLLGGAVLTRVRRHG